jgi:hypothetical protein
MDPSWIADTVATVRHTDADMTHIAHDSTKKLNQSSRLLQQVSDSVDDAGDFKKTMSPTEGTPESKASKERAMILKIEATHLYVIQAGLLTILLCILAYVFMPLWAANMAALAILATGIAAAIYLSQI